MNMKTWLQAIVASALSAGGALAGSTCSFDTVCRDGQPCAAAKLEIVFRAGIGGPNDIELDVGDEVVAVAVGGNARVAHLAGLSQTAFHVLTLANGSGAARYTRHDDGGPVATTWIGTCEVGR